MSKDGKIAVGAIIGMIVGTLTAMALLISCGVAFGSSRQDIKLGVDAYHQGCENEKEILILKTELRNMREDIQFIKRYVEIKMAEKND